VITTLDMLGPYRFRHWLGDMPSRQQYGTEVFTRPGVNYHAVRIIGLRSPTFQRESIIDVPSVALGRQLYASYTSLLGLGSVRLVWSSYDFDFENVRVIVLGCEVVYLRRNLAIANPLVLGNMFDLRVSWTLLFTNL